MKAKAALRGDGTLSEEIFSSFPADVVDREQGGLVMMRTGHGRGNVGGEYGDGGGGEGGRGGVGPRERGGEGEEGSGNEKGGDAGNAGVLQVWCAKRGLN